MFYFVFKLNLQPNIINIYSKEEFEAVVSQDIPLHLVSIMDAVERNNGHIEIFLPKLDGDLAKKIFEQLKVLTEELAEEYSKILEGFENGTGINYSKSFLDKNEECGNLRRKLTKFFPMLKESFSKYEDDEIDQIYNLHLDFHVGTGITHIRKFYKMDAYINEIGINEIFLTNTERMFYNKNNERIIVESANQEAALRSIKRLEKYINSKHDFYFDLGKVKINPIYENIVIKGNVTEITYTTVYPNGNPSFDRDNILSKANAKAEKTTLFAPDGQELNVEEVEKEVNKKSKYGYTSGVEAKGINAKVLSVIKKIPDLFIK